MSLTSVLGAGRPAAEARMTDACSSRRQAGTTHDDATGETVPTWTAVYSGPCRVKQSSAQASTSTAGEAEVLLQQPELHLPISAAMHRPGDEVTITASATDPALVGRVFRIRAVPAHSQATARRYGVTERTS
jgi:Family of unknown function (DUF6093)